MHAVCFIMKFVRNLVFIRIQFLLLNFFVNLLIRMNSPISNANTQDSDYLPQNDEFIPPTNFAMIEKGFYRSIFFSTLFKIGSFPVKRNFPFLRHLGIRSILYRFILVNKHVEFLFQKNILKKAWNSWNALISNCLNTH